MNMRKLTILAVLTTGLLALSCGSKSDGGGDRLQGEIQIDGSSTVYPITEAIAEEFRIEQPDVEVTIGVSGTGGGFKASMKATTILPAKSMWMDFR